MSTACCHYLLSLPDDWEVSRANAPSSGVSAARRRAQIFRSLCKNLLAKVEVVAGEDGYILGTRLRSSPMTRRRGFRGRIGDPDGDTEDYAA